MRGLVDKKNTKQIRIDSGIHKLVKVEAARLSRTIRSLVEESLADLLAIQKQDSDDAK